MPVTYYDWDELEDNIVGEYDGEGNVIAEYNTEPTLHGNVTSQYRDGVTSYFHSDGRGNVVAVTNDDGDVTDTFEYNAFGEVTARTGITEVPFQFGGQKGYYTDFEVPYISVRRRNYEPMTARWMSVDPIFFGDTRNVYRYARNEPLNRIDPTGMLCETCCCCAEDLRTGLS